MSQQGSCRCCVSFSFLSTRHIRNHSILPYHERLPLLLVVSLAKWWHAEVGHRTRHDNIETHRNSKISGNLWNIFGNWPTFFSSQCLELLCLRHALLLTCCLRLQNIRRENHKRKELPKVSHMQKWKNVHEKWMKKCLEHSSWYRIKSQLPNAQPLSPTPRKHDTTRPFCASAWLRRIWLQSVPGKMVESTSCCKPIYSSLFIYHLSWPQCSKKFVRLPFYLLFLSILVIFACRLHYLL